MKDVKIRTRIDWIKRSLGRERRYTPRNFLRARWRLMERGYIMPADAAGAAYEQIAAVRQSNPAAALVKSYIAGARWFGVDQIESAIEDSVFRRTGVVRLANLGFAITRQLGDRLELTRLDTRAARFVNEARLGSQLKGFGVHPLIEGLLGLRHPPRRRVNITDDRRLMVAERLAEFGIECDDILAGRMRIRLASKWTLKRAA